MIKHYCDKCGKKIPTDTYKKYIFTLGFKHAGHEAEVKKEYCENCGTPILRLLDNIAPDLNIPEGHN